MQVANAAPTPQLVGEFLALDRYQAMTLVLRYRRMLTDRGLAPSTINTRLAAIKSLVGYARKVGECHYDLADVEGVRVETYRDTSGVNPTEYQGNDWGIRSRYAQGSTGLCNSQVIVG